MVTRARIGASALLVLALALPAAPARATPPYNTRDELICRAASAVGYSYDWGGSCWCHTGCSPNFGACWAGSCSGSCPGCTHSGPYGADCSGLVNKTWQVPDPIATTTCGHGPYVANSFRSSTSYWSVISRSNLLRGDALASTTHVMIFHYGDPWGSMVTYEAKGCSYGVVHNWRTCSSSYSAARRIRISDCACTPGQTQNQACGNCGYRTRSCGSNCQWGGWSSCQGQGACAPGATQSRACCDCGSQSRSCANDCQWRSWSACAGPDPGGGNQACDTGESGPCAEGVRRCIDGCLTCQRVHDPEPEICDGTDNDCDGAVDDGQPSVLGTPPPPFAARLVDASYPRRLQAGETGRGWVVYENVGTETWPAGEIWLAPVSGAEEAQSPLHDPESWPAYNVLSVSPYDAAPGDTVRMTFRLAAAPELQQEITAEFTLLTPTGEAIACPSPILAVTVGPSQRPASSAASTPPRGDSSGSSADAPPAQGASNSSGCQTGPGPLGWLPLLLGLGWLGWRRRRFPAV